MSDEQFVPQALVDPAPAKVQAPGWQGVFAEHLADYRSALDSILRGKFTRAGVFLVFRQAIVTALGIGSSVAVARWLGPQVVGRFAILIFITQGILGYFGDLGLKAALIRKPGQLDEVELATAHKFIFLASLGLAVTIGAFLPLAFHIVHLGPENYLPAIWLLALLVVRNFRLVPLAIMERGLRFGAVSAVEAFETLIYTVVVATAAYYHWGVWAFVIAMSCRDLFGATVFQFVARPPWRHFQLSSIRPHAKFSLYYQGGAVMNLITAAFPTVVLARAVGQREVGYVSWAAGIALYALVICNALARMYLPAFSSTGGDTIRLRELVQKAVRVNASIAWPLCAMLASLSQPIISLVFTKKWLPAQYVLYAYCFSAVMLAIATPVTELFFAVGDAAFTFRFCALVAGLTWSLGLWSVLNAGLNGFAMFFGLAQLTWLIAFLRARRNHGLHLFHAIQEPLWLSVFLVIVNRGLQHYFQISFAVLMLVLMVEGIVFAAFLARTLLSLRQKPAPVAAVAASAVN